jgi:hypothetical protein
MKAIRLRTMARKSVFGFGKYADQSVQQLLDRKEYKALRWYYYYCSNISFLPDILEEAGITEEYRIAKPGTDPDMDERLQKRKSHRFRCMIGRLNVENPKAAIKKCVSIKVKKMTEAKERFRQFVKEDKKKFSKGAMAWKNQGH